MLCAVTDKAYAVCRKDQVKDQREYKRKKAQKKVQRMKQLEEEREVEKNKWLSFNTKVSDATL